MANADTESKHQAPGGRLLEVMADARIPGVLSALTSEPASSLQLSRRTSIPRTTLRGLLGELTEIGALTRGPERPRSQGIEYGVTPAGRELLSLLEHVARTRQAGALGAGPKPAMGVANLADLRTLRLPGAPELIFTLGQAPLGAAALERRFTPSLARGSQPLTHHQLQGRLDGLLATGFAVHEDGRYLLTDAGRRAPALLALAAHFEERWSVPGTVPTDPRCVAASLRTAAPLLRGSRRARGHCELRVRAPDEEVSCHLVVDAEGMRPVPVTARQHPAAILAGSAQDWSAALVEGRGGVLRGRGDVRLAATVFTELRERLPWP